jgi:hypothetical protein
MPAVPGSVLHVHAVAMAKWMTRVCNMMVDAYSDGGLW